MANSSFMEKLYSTGFPMSLDKTFILSEFFHL